MTDEAAKYLIPGALERLNVLEEHHIWETLYQDWFPTFEEFMAARKAVTDAE